MAQVSANRQPNGGGLIPLQGQQPSSFDCAADGTVVNSITGEPIARAHVNLSAGGSSYAASTDGSGRWALSNVGCARAQLIVTRTGFLQNGSRAGGAVQQLSLVSGSPAHDIKAQLVPQSVAVGKVQDDQGDPVQNVQITAATSRVVDGKLRFQQAAAGQTNDLGEYRLAALPAGKYIFCAHVNSTVAPATSQTITADNCYPGPPEGGAASAMDLAAGRETKVDFTMAQVVAIHIRGSISGMPEGRGIGVNLIRRGATEGGAPNFPGQVRDGKFDFRVPPGSYMLTADYFEAGKRLTARVPVDAGSSDVDNVVVHLDTGFDVTGVVRVVSQSGRTPGQLGFMLKPSESVAGTGQLKWNPDHTSFTMAEMVPGSFRLDSNPPAGFYVASATLAGQDILNNEIPISQAAGPIEITLRDDGGSIEGDVVDAAGQPTAGIVMLLRGTARVTTAVAQAGGHFKLQSIQPGDYTVYAWDDVTSVQYGDPDWMRRNATGSVPVTVTAGQSSPQIKLTRQTVP